MISELTQSLTLRLSLVVSCAGAFLQIVGTEPGFSRRCKPPIQIK
jgi:hypothetical protein